VGRQHVDALAPLEERRHLAVEGRVVGVDHDLDVAERGKEVVVHGAADEGHPQSVRHRLDRVVVPRLPNIVFILADDLGYGDFSCFNDGLSSTPVLDGLVAEGTTLTQHYSASPVCAPARASFLTGRYPHRTGAIDTLEGRGLDRLLLDEVTVADLLRRAGYVTGLVGKWHNGAFDDRYHPNQRGFDEFAGFRGGWSDYWNWRLDRNGSMSASDGRHLTDVLTDEARAFVTRHRSTPFFLHLAYSAPHFPLQSHPADAAPFLERRDDGLTTAVANLYGLVRGMDRGIGSLLDHLSELGLLDDTLVVFSSDNGPQFGGEGDACTTRFNCGYRGAKLLVYEGGIRLPAVLRWPNGLPGGGSTVDELVHFTDWLPTLLAVAGLGSAPAEVRLDGVDVLGVLRGEGPAASVPTTRFWQWNRYEPVASCNAAMRDGDWKLVFPALPAAMEVLPADLARDVALKYRPDEVDAGLTTSPLPERELSAPEPAQLFDLRTDPFELDDRSASEPARVSAMTAALGQWFEDVELDRRRRSA
jgi:arylsulfatase A